MVNKEEKKILNLVKILPLFMIIFSIIVTYIIISDNNKKFELEIEKLKVDSLNTKKELIKDEVQRVYKLINNEDQATIEILKKNIKEKVNIAHVIATTIYEKNKNLKTKQEIKEMIKDALVNIRFNDERGYFFIYSLDYECILLPVARQLEGQNFYNFQDGKGMYLTREITKQMKKEKEGFLTWWYHKPSDMKKKYEKIGFNKYFEPLDWFIGTGEYVNDTKEDIQKQILKKIGKIKYGKNGYIFVYDEKGVNLSHYKKENIGKNRINLRDADGYLITKEIIKMAQKDDGGFISYIGTIKPSTGEASRKISYILGYKAWKWAIGSGAYLSDINEIISSKRIQLEKENQEQITFIFIISFFLSVLFFILSTLFSNIIKNKFVNYKLQVEESTKKLVYLNKTLEKKVEIRTQSLNKQTDRVTNLLDNADQGFLSFDKDFLIDAEYSLECEHLIDENLKEKDITELLFPTQPDKVLFFKETVIDVLKEKNELTSSLLLTLLPLEMIINKRAILIKYKILSGNRIMMILTNITDKIKLQSKIKTEQIILKMIVSIVSDTLQFYEVKKSFEEFCQDCLLYININHDIKENCNNINALVHTFKGLFAQLYMKETVKELHHFESEVFKLTHDIKNNNDLKDFIESFNLIGCMNKDLEIISQTLGESFLTDHNQIKIEEKLIVNLENKIGSFCSIDEKQKKECEEILYDIKKIRYKSLKHYLSIYPKLCQQLCLSINKSIYNFEIIGLDEYYISDNYKPFINSLIHVFRNCCDHGIENKEERTCLNKNEVGSINCNFKLLNNTLQIEITDDGKGIDVKELKKKIILKKLIPDNEISSLTENAIINFIFDINFSTMDSITQISGRGIGLASVKIELDKLNGSVEIKTKKNEGTSFLFKLPLDKK